MEQGASTITAGGLAFTLLLGILLLTLPRRYALLPLLISGCYLTLGQVLLVGPLHFSAFRIILLFGWVRIVARNELARVRFNYIDKMVVAWTVVGSLMYILDRGASSESFIDQLGASYNAIGSYFLARALIRDTDDMIRAVRLLAIVIIPLAVFFTVEYATGKNIFSFFGGAQEFAEIRNGRIRCQGSFSSPILAGTFAATAMPLFIGLWVQSHKRRLLAASAIAASAVIVFCSSSSGPLLAFMIGMLGLLSWVIRSEMRVIRWGIVLTILALQMVMNAPVWYLAVHLGNLIGAGDGWYRSALIGAAVQHFGEWWLMGTSYTAHWMPTGLANDPNNADIVNQFIAEGVRGGVLTVFLFIWLIVSCFKTIGRARRDETHSTTGEQFMIWAMGCSLLGHVASFFSVSYFDQIIIFWYLLLAAIATFATTNKMAKYSKVRTASDKFGIRAPACNSTD